MEKREKWSRLTHIKLPHTYVIIFVMIVLAALLTHIVPAGSYDRYENSNGTTVVDPNSFHAVEANPAGIMDVFEAIPAGLEDTASLIFFVFIVGGAFQVINGTGAIDLLIGKLIRSLKGHEQLIIPIFLFVFSLGGAVMGMSNEVLPFVPIGIMLARKAGYDALVGTSIVTLGASAGFAAGAMNPFNVGIAQGIAELPIYSGIQVRIVLHVLFLLVASIYIMRYAARVKADPTRSYVRELELDAELEELDEGKQVSIRHYLVLLTFFAGLAWIIWGVIRYAWGTSDMQPVFLVMAVVGGAVGGLNPNQIAKEFVNGAKALTYGALVIGIARGILVVLQNGMILDTIVCEFAQVLQQLPAAVTPLGMLVIHAILNLVIPSGSGQAAATMPLFIPLADLTGVTRQVAVLAFQLGDGVTNSINPTASNMNGYLSLSKINYAQWLRFAGPLMGMWFLISAVAIVVCNTMGYGPF